MSVANVAVVCCAVIFWSLIVGLEVKSLYNERDFVGTHRLFAASIIAADNCSLQWRERFDDTSKPWWNFFATAEWRDENNTQFRQTDLPMTIAVDTQSNGSCVEQLHLPKNATILTTATNQSYALKVRGEHASIDDDLVQIGVLIGVSVGFPCTPVLLILIGICASYCRS